MKALASLLLFSFLMVIACPQTVYSQKTVGLEQIPFCNQAQTDSIFKLFAEMPDSVQWALALINGDSTAFYGLLKTDSLLSRIDNREAVFEVGSITKIFTASLFARDVYTNFLDLHAPVQDFFPFPLPITDTITLLQLANHTSGLPRLPANMGTALFSMNPYKEYHRDDLIYYLQFLLKTETKPGTTYKYSNLGYGLLGHILEHAHQTSYQELLSKYVTIPVGMPSTAIQKSLLFDSLIVVGRNAKGKKLENWDFDALAGAGALLSNVKDLSAFLHTQFVDTSFFRLARQETFSVNNSLAIGLGWHILKNEGQHPIFFHNGATGGFTAALAFDTQTQNGAIILANCTSYFVKSSNVTKATLQLLDGLGRIP